jgi:hypothetical protein
VFFLLEGFLQDPFSCDAKSDSSVVLASGKGTACEDGCIRIFNIALRKALWDPSGYSPGESWYQFHPISPRLSASVDDMPAIRWLTVSCCRPSWLWNDDSFLALYI